MICNLEIIRSAINQIPQLAQKSPEWLEKKQTILTATDVPTILNCNPFQTPAQLFAKKCGHDPPTSTLSTEWGEKFEPIAKQHFQQRHTPLGLWDLGLATHPTNPQIGASPDGLVIFQDLGHEGHDRVHDIWLIEIKCPYQRPITRVMPYNYWLQIQTQLYVWQPLLAQVGLTLRGCLYCENQFDRSDAHLVNYWEQKVTFDQEFYQQQVLPQVAIFQIHLDHFRPSTSASADGEVIQPLTRKRKRLTQHLTASKRQSLGHDLYYQYLKTSQVMTQKVYRNYINQDPLLDWLQVYGDVKHLPKDPVSSSDLSLKTYIYHQSQIMIKLIYDYIKAQLNAEDYVEITPQTLPQTPYSLDSHVNSSGIAQPEIKLTIESLHRQVPVIMNGVLFNPDNQSLGRFHVICRLDYLKTLFPTAYRKLGERDPRSYTYIQIRYSKLKLCAKNLYLLNVGSQKAYKIEHAHLQSVWNYYVSQPDQPSLIMGRKSTYSTKGITSDNHNSYHSFGIVDFRDRDQKIQEDLRRAQIWLKAIKTNGETWSIDPPDRPELYPNLKNQQDSPWSALKQSLGTKNRDLTQMWHVGHAERQRLWELNPEPIARWDQLDVDTLKYNDHYKSIIKNIIKSNLTQTTDVMDGQPVNLDQLGTYLRKQQRQIEFYLDFEFVGDLIDDFQTWPMANTHKFIYMIGLIYINHETHESQYFNYLVDRLDKTQEIAMLRTFFSDLDRLNHHQPDLHVYHWGMAEKTQLTDYLKTQDQLYVDGTTSAIVRKLQLYDLCDLFKNFMVAIPTCFGFGLKEIAKACYQQGWIATTWADGLGGEDALMASVMAEKECREGRYPKLRDVPMMTDFITYNSVDCRVMWEIVDFLRQEN